MSHAAHSGPTADGGSIDWAFLVDSMHERSWQRRHHSPALLLARRERLWRLHDRPAEPLAEL